MDIGKELAKQIAFLLSVPRGELYATSCNDFERRNTVAAKGTRNADEDI